jgi:hypothetical protein
VQERTGHGDVPVDAGEGRADRADALRHREAVLEQAVPVGLVEALGRRGVAVQRPQRRPRADDALEQRVQVRLAHRRDEVAQAGLHLLDRASGPVNALRVRLLGVVLPPHRAAR